MIQISFARHNDSYSSDVLYTIYYVVTLTVNNFRHGRVSSFARETLLSSFDELHKEGKRQATQLHTIESKKITIFSANV